MSMLVECPSGLSGSVRALSGAEIVRVLGDRKLARSGMLADKVLDLCWEETISPGPYVLEESGKLDWQEVLSGDRFMIVTRISAATFGKTLSFGFQCHDRVTCKKRGTWDLDLIDELQIKPYPEGVIEQFKLENKFEGVLPDGKRMFFRIPTGADEVAGIKMAKDDDSLDTLIPGVCQRIISIDGVETSPMRHKMYFESRPGGDVFDASQEMDRFNGGVQTSFDIECPKCFLEMAVEIPFDKLLAPRKRAPTPR